MKKITVDNYEAWFLDYIEGRLDTETMLALEAFLRLHPQLKEELEQASSFQLSPDLLLFEYKDELKKFQFEKQPINAATFNDFCIAAHEGLLMEKKMEELSNFMQTDTALFREYIAYGKAKLKAENIVFSPKDKLYRKVEANNRRVMIMWTSIAAGMALLLGIYMGVFNDKAAQHIQTVTYTPSSKVKIEPKVNTREEVVAAAKDIVNTQHSSGIKAITPVKVETIVVANREREAVPESIPQNKTKTVTIASLGQDSNAHTDSVFVAEQKVDSLVKTSDEGEKRKFLAFVEEGIEKINKVTNSDNLALAHETTRSGEIKSFRIKLGFIGFERKKSRND